MKQNPTASDWAAARGDKWCAQLAGMEPTLVPVDEPLVDALAFDGPARVAEVGCGGGATARAILRRAPAGSVVHGFDISSSLIELAQRRADAEGDALVFQVADMATAVPECPYDRLVSRFGVMFFDDPPAAFANLARWLRPGGRFAFAVWGPLSDNPWHTLVRDEVSRVVAVPAADPTAPGPFRYADATTLVRLLERSGFITLDMHTWRGALPLGGALAPGEAAHFALSSFSAFAELLAKAGHGAFEQAHRALTSRMVQHERDGAVRLEASVRIVTGKR